MKRLLLGLIYFLPLFTGAQNLLMNGGFEDENICSEYIKNCAPEAWISTSLYADYYFDDPPHAHAGQHFVGLPLADEYRPTSNNFIRSRLLCGLRKGAQYQLEFHIRSTQPVFDSVGIYFSTADFLYQKDRIRLAKPQLLLKQASLKQTAEWQKVSLTYTASGEENFIVIGDFKRYGHKSLRGRADLNNSYYFFIDDISLKPVNAAEHLCNGAGKTQEEEYEFNVRHSLLDKLVYVYTKNPPPVEPLPKTIVQRIDTLIIPDVLFATNSYTLTKTANGLLDSLLLKTKALQVDSLVVEGHTDSQGSLPLNQKLSENRAASVAGYFRPQILSAIITRGWASLKPVANNNTADGRQKNRRVEIYIYVRE